MLTSIKIRRLEDLDINFLRNSGIFKQYDKHLRNMTRAALKNF